MLEQHKDRSSSDDRSFSEVILRSVDEDLTRSSGAKSGYTWRSGLARVPRWRTGANNRGCLTSHASGNSSASSSGSGGSCNNIYGTSASGDSSASSGPSGSSTDGTTASASAGSDGSSSGYSDTSSSGGVSNSVTSFRRSNSYR